ncbi:MAG: glycosyltransferase [Candidatus Saccharimonadales bacterium]
MAYRLIVSLRRFSIKKTYTAAIEAPSVSVCIPARNETHAMTECLERVLASDYRKLEVIVYDDSSADDTSILIRSFAHAGVRFVPGGPLPDGWLGKNHALSVLANEASGTYVLFMDVDTIIEPTTISQLVGYTMTENMVMASVIPSRINTLRQSVLFGHLRYYWQLIVSRPSAPATSSSLWMINRHVLLDTLGGFAPHRAQVEPESHIAAIIGTGAYHCLVSNDHIGVNYEKKWRSQVETSQRLLYPMMGGNAVGGLLGLLALLLVNVPTVGLVSALWLGWTPLHAASVAFLVAFGVLYSIFTYRTWRGHWWLAILTWPFVVAQEFVLAIMSVWGYARGTITWKGRSIVVPSDHIDSSIK